MNNPASGNSIIQVNSFQNHDLRVGDHVWLDFSNGGAGIIQAGEFTVSTIVDQATFKIVAPVRFARSEVVRFIDLYALVPPPITRTGKIGGESSKWMGNTNGIIGQTPYRFDDRVQLLRSRLQIPGRAGRRQRDNSRVPDHH